MALLGTLTKQPSEELPVDISYASVIGERAVESLTIAVTAPSGMTLVSSDSTSSACQLYVGGGTDGVTYKWTVFATITIGGKLTKVEDEFNVIVEET